MTSPAMKRARKQALETPHLLRCGPDTFQTILACASTATCIRLAQSSTAAQERVLSYWKTSGRCDVTSSTLSAPDQTYLCQLHPHVKHLTVASVDSLSQFVAKHKATVQAIHYTSLFSSMALAGSMAAQCLRELHVGSWLPRDKCLKSKQETVTLSWANCPNLEQVTILQPIPCGAHHLAALVAACSKLRCIAIRDADPCVGIEAEPIVHWACSGLEKLDVGSGMVMHPDTVPTLARQCPSLIELRLRSDPYNYIVSWPSASVVSILDHCKQLRVLQCPKCNFWPLVKNGRYPSLKTLILDPFDMMWSCVDSNLLILATVFGSLTELGWGAVLLSHDGLAALSSCSWLSQLALPDCRLDGTTFGELCLPSLTQLDLSGTEFDDHDAQRLVQRCPHLVRLNLGNTKITASCLATGLRSDVTLHAALLFRFLDCFPHLRQLSTPQVQLDTERGQVKLFMSGDRDMQLLAQHWPRLQCPCAVSLEAHIGPQGITERALEALAPFIDQIQHWSLWCGMAFDTVTLTRYGFERKVSQQREGTLDCDLTKDCIQIV